MVLLIDNYDSFTYNLYDYVKQLGHDCQVVRNDELCLDEIEQLDFSSIIISPGPCTPNESGIVMAVIQRYYQTKPILGICLGHQAIGVFFDAKLDKALKPMHGKTSLISIQRTSRLFENCQEPLIVMRYHSLVLNEVKSPLKIIATTAEGEVMGVEHESLPIAGLQFHPESILTTSGLQILDNWFKSI